MPLLTIIGLPANTALAVMRVGSAGNTLFNASTDGNNVVIHVQPGYYSIRASHMDYVPTELQVYVGENEMDTEVHIAMPPDLVRVQRPAERVLRDLDRVRQVVDGPHMESVGFQPMGHTPKAKPKIVHVRPTGKRYIDLGDE